MQDKASQPLIESLQMILGVPYADDPDSPLNIEIPLQVALPDGQTLYAAVALGGLPFHGQQQIAERITAAWNAFAGVATANIPAPRQCLLQIQEPATKTEALAHYSQQAILAMDEAAPAAAPVVLPEPVYTMRVNGRMHSSYTPTMSAFDLEDGEHKLYTEQQVRALLAGLSAPAMAVPSEDFKLSVYSALGCGSEAAEFAAVSSIQNLIRRESCLSAVERQFFMVATPPDEDEGETEPGEECLLNWGQDPEQYAAQFEEALKRIAPQAQADARDAELLDFIESHADGVIRLDAVPNYLYWGKHWEHKTARAAIAAAKQERAA